MSNTNTDSIKTIDTNQEFFGEFFNDNSVDYLSKSAGSRWFKYLLSTILEKIEPNKVASVADVGCGIGHKTHTLKEYFKKADVNGFDFSAPAIKVAKKAYGPSNIYYSCEDITKSTYKKRYDLISAFDVLEHIDDWKGLVKKLAKVNNKYLILSSPVGRMRPYEAKIGHFRNFKRNEMEDFMVTLGYSSVKTIYAGFPFFSPITRDLTQLFFKSYSQTSQTKMSKLSQFVHNVWYILYRYFSSKKSGDIFIGLFEKTPQKRTK